MPNVTTLVDDLSSKIRENIKQGEDTTLKTVESWTGTIEGMLPERFANLEAIERLPKPKELVELSFDFADRVIEFQVELLKTIAGAIEPVMERVGLGAEVPAPKATANGTSTAAKSTAAKGTAAKARTTKSASKASSK